VDRRETERRKRRAPSWPDPRSVPEPGLFQAGHEAAAANWTGKSFVGRRNNPRQTSDELDKPDFRP